jgi:endoglycosylceramidase
MKLRRRRVQGIVCVGAALAVGVLASCSTDNGKSTANIPEVSTTTAAGGDDRFAFDVGDTTPEPTTDASRHALLDEAGRTVILRGVNVESASKTKANGYLPASGMDQQKAMLPFGWNGVRFLVTWAAIEPTKGTFDEAYLDRVEQWLDWYRDHDIHVVLDMHQDLYSEAFNGDGAPEWAVFTDGLTFKGVPEGGPWYLAAADPATQAAYQNFWDPAKPHAAELQQHYLAALAHLADRFKDHPAVIAYDVMNEPVFANGDLGATLARVGDAAAGNFHNDRLMSFTQRAIDAVRSVDTENWVYFEPTSLLNAFPYPGDLDMAGLRDGRKGAPRLGYAPHFYEMSVHDGTGYPEGSPYVSTWEKYRGGEAATLGGPLWVGEVGAGPDNARMYDYVSDFLAMSDRLQAGWAWWSWDPGGWSPVNPDFTMSANGKRLIRVQPRAVSGDPTSFGWDAAKKRFDLAWTERDGVTAPTEIAVPADAFDTGWVVVLDGKETRSYDYSEERAVLSIRTPRKPQHTVCIAPTAAVCG